MPRFANEADRLFCGIAENWIITAREWVMDVEGWREAAETRDQFKNDPSKAWRKLPSTFQPDTEYLLSELEQRKPNLDRTPLEGICEALKIWEQEHSARRLPDQQILKGRLTRAVRILHNELDSINERVIP
jgi:hypothetical protein